MAILSHVVRFVAASVVLLASDQRPSFDVATVKANKSGTGVDRIKNEPGIVFIQNVSLKRLIAMAYEIPEYQQYLFSGPDWLDSENYDIQARYAPDTPKAQYQLMFQRLLDERFRMTLHREPKEFSVLALVKGSGRIDHLTLHPSPNPNGAPGGAYKFKAVDAHATGSSISMAMLAGRLSRPDFGLDRPVLDLTAMEGTFDLTLDWSDASIFDAIKEQLGLKLEPRKVSLEVLVVDRANRVPIEN
jgi:uncharacterized protein (TIGR03435 family)